MKTIILTLAILLSSFATFAGTEPKNAVPAIPNEISIATEAAKAAFVISTVETLNSDIDVFISNENGQVILKQHYAKGQILATRFKLDYLPNGTYSFLLRQDKSEKVCDITIENHQVVTQTEMITRWLPNVKYSQNHIDVHWLMQGSNTSSIEILDISGKVIEKIRYPKNQILSQRFNVSELESGDYTVIVRGEGHSYQQIVHIER